MKSQHQRVDAFVHGRRRRRRRCFSSSWDARATARFRQSGVAHDDEHKRRLFFISGEKNSNFFFCSLSCLGFLSKKRLSQFEPRFSRRKTHSRLRKARNLTTQRITKQTQRSLCEAKENAEMSFSCSNVLQSPSFARGGALHASSSSKTHKSKAAFAVRAADDGTYFIVKPIHYAQFFRCIASKSAKNEEGRDVGVGKTNAS